MGLKWQVNATSIDHLSYRVDIYEDGYSGSLIPLNGEVNFISFSVQGEQVSLDTAFRTRSPELQVYDPNETLSSTYRAADRTHRVEIFRKQASSSTFPSDPLWVGYLLSDFYEYEPLTFNAPTTLRLTEGLGTLKGEAFDPSGYSGTPQEADIRQYIADGLSKLEYSLPINIVQTWYPGWLATRWGNGDQPLEYLRALTDNFQEDRTALADESYISWYDVLRACISAFDLTLLQSDGEWWALQRSELVGGTVQRWQYNADGTLATSDTPDLTFDLSTVPTGDDRGSFWTQRSDTHRTHDFDEGVLDQMIKDPSFEVAFGTSASDWSVTRSDEVRQGSYPLAGKKADANLTDVAFAELDGIENTNWSTPWQLTQRLPIDFRGAGTVESVVSLDSWVSSGGAYREMRMELETGDGFFLTEKYNELQHQGTWDQDRNHIQIDPIQGSAEGQIVVPEGTTLKLVRGPSAFNALQGTIDLDEPLRVGDNRVVGELSNDLDFTEDHYLFWAAWESSQGIVTLPTPGSQWLEYTLVSRLRTPNGVAVSGVPTLRFYCQDDASSGNREHGYLDHVRVGMQQEGDPIGRVTGSASLQQAGETDTTGHRIGQGPTEDAIARLRAEDHNNIIADAPDNWTSGATSEKQDTLKMLHAAETLRMRRNHLKRREVQTYPRAPADVPHPHQVVSYQGSEWTVHRYQYEPGEGRLNLVLIELREDGNTNINTQTVYGEREDDDTDAAAPTASVGGSAGGASTWDELTGKPTDLFARNGDSDGFAETIALTTSDITTALSFTPADEATQILTDSTLTGGGDLSADRTIGIANGGVDTTQIAADAVGPSEVDSGTLTAFPIDISGDADTVDTHDAAAFVPSGGTNITTGTLPNPTINVSPQGAGSGLSADDVDGYDGADLAALAEDEAITGTWTFNVRIKFADVGRILWDEDKDGDPLYIQREPTGSETAVAITGTSVGINGVTSPSYSLDVGGTGHLADGLLSGSYAKHTGFADGWTGSNYEITGAGDITAESLFLRGPLTVSELIVNRIHAVDGTQIIGPGRGRIESVSGSAPTETVDLEDPNDTGVTSFTAGDLIIVQEVDVDNSTIVKRIVREVDSVDNANAQITLRDHADGPADAGSLASGDTVVVFGHISDTSRQNVLVATATNDDAPYRRTISGVDSWSAWQNSDKVTTQTGNISNLTPDSPGPGLYGSSVRLEDDILIGDLSKSGQYLEYASGTLTLKGTLTITGGSGISNLTDAGGLATQDDADWSTDITGSGKPADNADVTANNTAADIANLPATPSGAGLYADSSHLGFYDGTSWSVYIEHDTSNNVGDFYLKGTNEALFWDGSAETLTIGNNFQYDAAANTLGIGNWTVGSKTITSKNITLAADVDDPASSNQGTASYICVHEGSDTSKSGSYVSLYYKDDQEWGLIGRENGTLKFGFGKGGVAFDSFFLEGDVLVDGSVTATQIKALTISTDLLATDAVTTDKMTAGAVTTDKITIDNALTLGPGGSFFAGSGNTRFAFGDFDLSRQVKGEQTELIGATVTVTTSDTTSSNNDAASRTDISVSTANRWVASAYDIDYDISTNATGDRATAEVELRALDSNGVVIDKSTASQVVTDGGSDSGQLSVQHTLPVGTEEVKMYLWVQVDSGSNSTAGGSASIGDATGTLDPKYDIISSTDFFGTKGAIWRDGGSIQIEINGRDTSAPNTTPGDIWIAGSYLPSSDRRHKEDITAVEDPMDVLSDIEGKHYQKNGRPEYGLIAQDVLAAGANDLVREGENGYALHYDGLHAFEVEALTDHERRIRELEQENERLSDLITTLSTRL